LRKLVIVMLCVAVLLSTTYLAADTSKDIKMQLVIPEKAAYNVSTPFRINSNADFATSGKCSGGNGSIDNPWIIENYDINGTGYGYCIYVGNTTDYFTIKDCYLHHASGGGSFPDFANSGIILSNVQNGNNFNNTVSLNDWHGIYLYLASSNTIANNTVSLNIQVGIFLCYFSDNNTVTNNNVSSNEGSGIIVEKSSDNIVANNNAYLNYNGIELRYHPITSYNTVANNTISSNDWAGIVLNDASANTIVNNSVSLNGNYGIYCDVTTPNNVIYHNNFINNGCQAVDNDWNQWDNGYPSGGNYWSNYTGPDNFYGPVQNMSGSDGIGDEKYYIYTWDGYSPKPDNYPLMEPWGGPVHNLDTNKYFGAIQTAIDDASTLDGHRIEVNAGTYYEHVVIDKRLSLFGKYQALRDLTIIDGGGSGDVVQISSDWVNVSGFTIRNSGVVSDVPANHVVISEIAAAGSDAYDEFVELYNPTTSSIDISGWQLQYASSTGSTWTAKATIGSSVFIQAHGFYLLANMGGDADYTIGNGYDVPASGPMADTWWDSTSGLGNSAGKVRMTQSDGDTLVDTLGWGSGTTGCEGNPFLISWSTPYPQWQSPERMALPDSVAGSGITGMEAGGGHEFLGNGYDSDDNSANFIQRTTRQPQNKANATESIPSSGIFIVFSSNSSVVNNIVSSNGYGIFLASSNSNKIYHNSFINNAIQAYDDNINQWDDGYPSGGNYWSDYTGLDAMSGPFQNQLGSDGIGDTPYVIDVDSQDHYPLMSLNGTVYPPATFSIPVVEGWNLISIPWIPNDSSLPNAFLDMVGDTTWDKVQWYDPLDTTDHWRSYCTCWMPQLNDLADVNHTMGVWLHVASAGDGCINVSGLQPSTISIPLYAGWNLVGYPSLIQKPVSEALVGTGYDSVEGFNASDPYRTSVLPGSYAMKPGEGYWVHVPFDTVWLVNWDENSDTTPPTVNFIWPQPNETIVSTEYWVKAQATDNAGVTIVELQIGNGTWQDMSWNSYEQNWQYHWMGYLEGNHTLRVRAWDAVGNSDLAIVNVTVNFSAVDTEPPVAYIDWPQPGEIITSTEYWVKTHASDNVGVTIVELQADNGTWLEMYWNSYEQNWQYHWMSYIQGNHTLRVRPWDAAGNAGLATVDVIVNFSAIDTEPPMVNFDWPQPGEIISSTDYWIKAHASDNVGVTIGELQIGNGTWQEMSWNSYEQNWQYHWTGYTDGNYTLRARAWDAAGNTGLAIVTVTVNFSATDTEPPVAVIDWPQPGETIVSTEYWVKAHASDNVGVTVVELRVDNGTWQDMSWNSYEQNWQYHWMSYLEGNHTLRARAWDAEGNSGLAIVTVTVNFSAVDTEPPVVNFDWPQPGEIIVTTDYWVKAHASDNVGVTIVELQIGNGTWQEMSWNSYEQNWQYHWTGYGEGNFTLKARAWDAAGNNALVIVTVTVNFSGIDTTAPTVTILWPQPGETIVSTEYWVKAQASDNIGVTVVELRVDNGTWLEMEWNSIEQLWQYHWMFYGEGSHTLWVRAWDAAGNSGLAVITVNVDFP
jgi:parallel beta-helix repeat protein